MSVSVCVVSMYVSYNVRLLVDPHLVPTELALQVSNSHNKTS